METGKRTSQTIAATILAALRNDYGVCWFSCTQVKENHGHVLQVMLVKSFSADVYDARHCIGISYFRYLDNSYLQHLQVLFCLYRTQLGADTMLLSDTIYC